MFVFGVVHLEFCLKAWTLCLMCTIALLYRNPRFEFDFNVNNHFEFSKWSKYIFAKIGILLQKWPCVYWYSHWNISIPWIKLPICMFLSRYLSKSVCLNVFKSICLNVCLNMSIEMSIYLSKCLNVYLNIYLNMCILNISICNTTCSCCLYFCSFSIVIINYFKQMGLSFQSGHGHVHIHMCCLFLVLLILNFIVVFGPYA